MYQKMIAKDAKETRGLRISDSCLRYTNNWRQMHGCICSSVLFRWQSTTINNQTEPRRQPENFAIFAICQSDNKYNIEYSFSKF
jgi:hypothetical protein